MILENWCAVLRLPMLENGAHHDASVIYQFDHQLSYFCDVCSEFCTTLFFILLRRNYQVFCQHRPFLYCLH